MPIINMEEYAKSPMARRETLKPSAATVLMNIGHASTLTIVEFPFAGTSFTIHLTIQGSISAGVGPGSASPHPLQAVCVNLGQGYGIPL